MLSPVLGITVMIVPVLSLLILQVILRLKDEAWMDRLETTLKQLKQAETPQSLFFLSGAGAAMISVFPMSRPFRK